MDKTEYSCALGELIQNLRTSTTQGLKKEEVSALRKSFGWNQLDSKPPAPRWKRLAKQFNQLIIWILFAGAILSGVIGDWTESITILAIVLLNGFIGFFQEEKAEKSLAALKKLSAPSAKVIRDGLAEILPASDLVPGDLIDLEAGDFVPADCRLIHSFSLGIQESALTGESVPVEKNAHVSLKPGVVLAERINMAFSGTLVTSGKASAIVTSTGMKTEIGKIAGLLEEQTPEPTPLQKRLEELGRVLAMACLGIVGLIFGLQLYRGGSLLEVILFSISLAIAAVPEGLPAVVTVALALGLQRMVKKKAIVRSLPSVETLGSVTVICSDKTGTLTRNEMTVRKVWVGSKMLGVSGSGYSGEGIFYKEDRSEEIIPPNENGDLSLLLKIGAYCNHARLMPLKESAQSFQVMGDPTEGALLILALKGGIKSGEKEIVHELPFDSRRKRMSVVVQDPERYFHLYTKGAVETVLKECRYFIKGGQKFPIDDPFRKTALETASLMSKEALRVLAFAYKEEGSAYHKTEESNLVFVGLVGMMDPPREEAKISMGICQEAGIRPIMITGDHGETALAIAKELGMDASVDAVGGEELEGMDPNQLKEVVKRASVYSRVSPEHKLQIVRALRENGEIVAMTGDGVNDAPALKAADIGIAMGITGTDVTKEASDMVLMDDNFATIVSAIKEGRGIFENIQKFVHYLLACNTSEILLVFIAAILGWPPPLLAIQILWINLVTDGPPALALAMEPPEPDVMTRNPRPPEEALFTLGRGLRILVHGCLVTCAPLFAFAYFYFWVEGGQTESLAKAQAIAFGVSAFSQLFFSFACRSHRFTLPTLGILSNPYLFVGIGVSIALQVLILTWEPAQQVFLSQKIDLGKEWVWIFGLSLIPVSLVESYKLISVLFKGEK